VCVRVCVSLTAVAPPAPAVAMPAAKVRPEIPAAKVAVAVPRAAVALATNVTEITLLTPRIAEELTL